MGSPNQITGRVIIKRDGEVLDTIEGASLDPGGVTRTPVPLDNGKIKHRVAVRHASIKGTIVDDAQAKWLDTLKDTDVVIIFETDTGAAYKLAPATSTGETEMQNGEAPVEWFGEAVKPI